MEERAKRKIGTEIPFVMTKMSRRETRVPDYKFEYVAPGMSVKQWASPGMYSFATWKQ